MLDDKSMDQDLLFFLKMKKIDPVEVSDGLGIVLANFFNI